MLSKWLIKGLEDYRVGEDGKIYRLPFTNGKKWYSCREVKKQYGNRYRMAGEWWTVKQLRERLARDPNPVELFKNLDGGCPF